MQIFINITKVRHRVAIVKGKRCPDIHVNALRIKAQKVSENEPVLACRSSFQQPVEASHFAGFWCSQAAKLGDRGVRALLSSKLIAAKLQHIGILKNAFQDSGGLGMVQKRRRRGRRLHSSY